MKILWICNRMLTCILEKEKKPVGISGGWMDGLYAVLKNDPQIELTVLAKCAYHLDSKIEDTRYCSFNDDNCRSTVKRIISEQNPDIIQIFGTEYKHSYEAVRACEEAGVIDRTVITIQGMVSVIGKYHYDGGIPEYVKHGYSIKDFIRRNNINSQIKDFQKRGIYEIEAIKKVKYIMGRTDWDEACTRQINPEAKYFHCDEMLRESFYGGGWYADKCEKHTVFSSQYAYPLKGFHWLVEAISIVRQFYPDVKVYVPGKNILRDDFKSRLSLSYYDKYVVKLIRKYGVERNISFLGQLGEQEMYDRYLKANVFVSASSIENSSNSVSEAMLLGVPTISSDVGGIKSLLVHGEEGFLYQYNAPYMLAECICRIFGDTSLAQKFSEAARKHAGITHNKEIIVGDLINIYKEIQNGGK